MPEFTHLPVLVDQVVMALRPAATMTVVDGTFGRGGYTRSLLALAPCRVIGIDQDPEAVESAAEIVIPPAAPAITVVEGRFSQMESLVGALGIDRVDGVMLDLGVSSPQLDDASRGFSIKSDGPLDMRMGRHGQTAAAIVNSFPETALADIIWRFGEERMSRRVASAIVAARGDAPIERTAALARIIRGVVPASRDGIDPATRTFQALRIYVNDEMGELRRGLSAAERLLNAGGRLAVVSFHSLEDRLVKQFLRARAGQLPAGSRHRPSVAEPAPPSFEIVTRKPITADIVELARNPRARSAKLRVAERTAAAAWPEELAA